MLIEGLGALRWEETTMLLFHPIRNPNIFSVFFVNFLNKKYSITMMALVTILYFYIIHIRKIIIEFMIFFFQNIKYIF